MKNKFKQEQQELENKIEEAFNKECDELRERLEPIRKEGFVLIQEKQKQLKLLKTEMEQIAEKYYLNFDNEDYGGYIADSLYKEIQKIEENFDNDLHFQFDEYNYYSIMENGGGGWWMPSQIC